MKDKEEDPGKNDNIKGINNLANFVYKNLAQMREIDHEQDKKTIKINVNGQEFKLKQNGKMVQSN